LPPAALISNVPEREKGISLGSPSPPPPQAATEKPIIAINAIIAINSILLFIVSSVKGNFIGTV
jgi:hypothetical protein